MFINLVGATFFLGIVSIPFAINLFYDRKCSWIFQLDYIHVVISQALVISLLLYQKRRKLHHYKSESTTLHKHKNKHPAAYKHHRLHSHSLYPSRSLKSKPDIAKLADEKFDQEHNQPANLFKNYLSLNAGDDWKLLHTESKLDLNVWSREPFCFKIEATMDGTAATAFDMFCDFENSSLGYEESFVERLSILQQIDQYSAIIHVVLKTYWPIQKRDMILWTCYGRCSSNELRLGSGLGLESELGPEADSESEFGYYSVAKSINPTNFVPNTDLDALRINVKFAGQLLIPLQSAKQSVDGRGKFKLIRIVDFDPMGYIPATLISYGISKTVPEAMLARQEIIDRLQCKDWSILLKEQPDEDKEPDQLAVIEKLFIRLSEKVDALESKITAYHHEQSSIGKIVYGLSPIIIVSLAAFTAISFGFRPNHR